jgi:hypothetical protein
MCFFSTSSAQLTQKHKYFYYHLTQVAHHPAHVVQANERVGTTEGIKR